MPNHLQEGKEVNFITFSIISSSSGRIETIKIQVGIYLLAFQPQSIQFRYRSGRRLGWGRSSLIILLRTFWYVLPPNYRSDPADEKENSALLLSRRTYPPRDSWNFLSRSRGRFAPCPRIWVICSHTMLLQSDLAGERSQFATENKTASERTFVRFFSTKHGSLRITVGRWLPKETPIRSAPPAGRHLPHPDHKERFTMMGGTSFFPFRKE
ncbi:hypothetical protein HanXRQr2_Chr14g0628311 [Helianthus annuus]|uniref:Uncharacterized protein n=1 Tax=Helianthus annuus TaxID=4232 RepID=A0A9K3E6F8_HELAN|nr:hypothetical protein HanXRQr2_Chr14g0628311 [Helianthus annuus]KAJ0427257.1 hypothetical protein HanIR_MTg0917471 [Helianthus annuus]KAJ0638394.1 hypothetical protein HanHA300_Chr00c0123g0714591 [Helianthus annuus]KAJ0828935.1 hypothetical protein HanLR1_Chr00c0060g0701861 [Helianthus annuus]